MTDMTLQDGRAQSEMPVSTSSRLMALFELVLISAVFFIVRDWATKAQLLGAGSLGIVSAVIAGTLTMKLRGGSWHDLGLKKPGSVGSWALTLGLAAAAIVTVYISIPTVVVPLLNALFDDLNFHTSGHAFDFLYGRPFALAVYIVVIAWGGAAFGEELFSRGLMLNRLAEVFGFSKIGWLVAVLGQAVFFGAAHAYQGTVGMFLTGSVGLIFGIFYLVGKRNLVPLILAHGIIDTIGLTQLYLANPVS